MPCSGSGENRMQIAMFGHKRIPSREGGIEIVVEELSVRMAALGYQITCFNRGGHHVSGADYDREQADFYKRVRIRKVLTLDRKGMAAMTASFSAAVLSAFGKYDVVHIHAEGPAAMAWLPKMMRKRVVVTVHGLDHQRGKWGRFASAYIRFGERNAVRFADEIIVLSRAVQNYFLETYGRKTVFIPNGVCRPDIVDADQIAAKWNLEKNGYVLYLGRIVPEKGLDYLLEAWEKTVTEKKLVLCGGSSDTDLYMKELMKKAGDNVIFTGFQQGRILEELYSNAYIYVLPSDLEGMPLSLLEAMSYGNCCLTSDIPECADVVEDRAVLFSRGNEEDLREKLQMLLDRPDLVESYRQQAADYVCGKYRWDDVVERTLKLYEAEGEREYEDSDGQ